MPYYELLCLAHGKLTRADLADLLRKTCRAFISEGATLTRISPLGARGQGPRELAYRIRHNQVNYDTGFYVNVCAFASPKALAEVMRQLSVDERILRYLPVKRRLQDAVEPIPDVDARPPSGSNLDPADPQYALKKFLQEYEREFPDGVTYKPQQDAAAQTDGRPGFRSDAGGDISEVVASLKASSKPASENKPVGLEWILDMDKDPPARN